MPKQMLPEDWFLGLLRSLKIGQEIDLLERATEGPRMRLLVKRTSKHQLVVNRKPATKVKAPKNRAKMHKEIMVRDEKGKVLYASYTSRPLPKALSTGSGKVRRGKDPVLAEAGEWFEKLNHPTKSPSRRLVEAYARNG